MRLLTCGSRLEIPSEIMQQFSGVVGGYHWNIWHERDLQSYAQQYGKQEIWSNFLYGNKHKSPELSSECTTIQGWITKRITRFQYVTHWTLINEFTDDKGNLYSQYEYEDIKNYLIAANQASPSAKLILSDFRPYQLEKWQKIKELCDQLLSESVPIHGIGIQVHFKTRNAHSKIPGIPFILDALPTVIQMFDGVLPVHLTEVSGWHHYSEPHSKLVPLWEEIVAIALQNNVETFCPWWLNQEDEPQNNPDPKHKSMPSFEEFRGAGLYTSDWNQLLLLSTSLSI